MTSLLLLLLQALSVSCFSVCTRSAAHSVAPGIVGSTRRSFSSSSLPARRKKDDDSGDRKKKKTLKGIDPAKQAALNSIMDQIERSHGRGSIINLGESNGEMMNVQCVSSGALTLDMALGGKGYPRGRVVEIYGPESSGKTTLALHAIAAAQSADPDHPAYCAFVDAEHALDPVYAESCGVNVDTLLISQPDSGEMALDIVDQLVRSSAVDLIVVDSVAALVPRAELEGDMSDMQIGLQARLMSKALRKICASLSSSGCTVIFLNQLRSKVGVIYGSPEVTSGGNALKFYSSIRLDCRRKEILPQNAGIKVKVKVVKNKIAAPFEIVELDIMFGTGIDQIGCLVDAAEEIGVLVRKGSWYYDAEGNNLAQGRSRVIELFKANDNEKAKELELLVRKSLEGGDVVEEEGDDDSEEDKPKQTRKKKKKKEKEVDPADLLEQEDEIMGNFFE